MRDKIDVIYETLIKRGFTVVYSSSSKYIKLKHPITPNLYYWISETGKVKSGHCVSQSFDITIFF